VRPLRELTLLSALDDLRTALRFPRCALNLARDCASGVGATPFPRRLGLFVTNRCDFACPMCAVQDARDDGLARGGDMPFEIVERVLEECSRHQPLVDWIGGEPLLYGPLEDAVRLASRRRVPSVVTTNGLKLAERAEALARAGLPFLQVSLDGWDEETQAARGRVRGSFGRLCEGVRAVKRARGGGAFPIVRILTAITRVNHAHLDRIQQVVNELGVRYWAITNYFYLNRAAHERHREFALIHGLSGAVAAHAIAEDTYLTPEQVRELKVSLARVRGMSRRAGPRISYAWKIDVGEYYSGRQASAACACQLPYTRLDVHTDGHLAVCVSGKRVGQAGEDTIAAVWRGAETARYRTMYERTRPMPMCFRCCGLSQTIRFRE